MSIPALEAQIDAVSKDMERQKQVLRTLESNKSLLQRQLNALRDPIARLPLEISSEIFVQCLPPHPVPGADSAPMLLLNVCNTWTDIALSTTALWTKVHLSLPRNSGFHHLLGKWLGRAHNHLLHVSARGHIDSGVATQIFNHSSHLGHLALSAEAGEDDEEDNYIDFRDFLGVMLPESLPVLHTLIIRSNRPALQIAMVPILQVLRLAPNLTELEFDAAEIVGGTVDGPPVVLSNLRCLSLSTEDEADFGSQTEILEYLSAPNLATLSLFQPSAEDNQNLLSFLGRSSPPLQRLVIADPTGSGCLYDILPLIPTLVELKVVWPKHSVVEDVFTLLGETLSTAVPNLKVLQFADLNFHYIRSWDPVVRALSARRKQIRTLRMQFGSSEIPIPPDVLAVLKELSAEGMDIWMGSWNSGENVFLNQ